MSQQQLSDGDAVQFNEADDYTFEVSSHLAPKLVELVRMVMEADNPTEAVWLDVDGRKDLARIEGRLESQLREQGYGGEL